MKHRYKRGDDVVYRGLNGERIACKVIIAHRSGDVTVQRCYRLDIETMARIGPWIGDFDRPPSVMIIPMPA